MCFNKTTKINSLIIAITIFIASCVPARLLEEQKVKATNCDTELQKQKTDAREAIDKYDDIKTELDGATKRLDALRRDTTIQGKSLAMITRNYDKLNETYNLLLDKNKELEAMDRADNKRLVGDLQTTHEQMQRKEDRLRKLEEDLEVKKANLDKLKEELETTTKDLKLREGKVAELQSILNSKDSVVSSLKKKVSDALTGFENNGLTIQKKNGKVYVSLEERLLFASGSTNVDAKGIDALKKLAKVLEQNTDINVLIEGHTDNVPFNSAGGGIKDNWDLSVLRATSIVKIIATSAKVDPTRLTAAGRGEFSPIDPANNAEARKKNRRTEIILTPKLDELLKVLNSN
jgi:chemotaxis protein MotB